MKVLAVDPGSNFGWAYFVDGRLKSWGDYDGYEADNQLNALTLLMLHKKVNVLVVEDVVKGSCTMPNWQGVWHTVGVQYAATGLAELHDAAVVPIGNQTLKAYLRRRLGLPGKSKVEKKQIVAYVNEKYGLELKQKHHNVADAICLGECYLARLEEGVA